MSSEPSGPIKFGFDRIVSIFIALIFLLSGVNSCVRVGHGADKASSGFIYYLLFEREK